MIAIVDYGGEISFPSPPASAPWASRRKSPGTRSGSGLLIG